MTLGYTDGKTKLKILFFTICAFSIVSLTVYELRKVWKGPQVILDCGECRDVVSQTQIYDISGKTANISEIHVGNKKIYIDSKGFFKESVLLYPGENMLSLHAKDRFGKEVKKDIAVYYIYNK